jgi:hypothetical protein
MRQPRTCKESIDVLQGGKQRKQRAGGLAYKGKLLEDWVEENKRLEAEVKALGEESDSRYAMLVEEQGRYAILSEIISEKTRRLELCQQDYANIEREMTAHLGRPFKSHGTDAVLILLHELSAMKKEKATHGPFQCAACGKVMQFADGMCWECYGGDPGQ